MAALPGKTVALGNPPSASHQISPVDLGDWMDAQEKLKAAGGVSYVDDTLAALNARSGVSDGEFALVVKTGDEGGTYERVGGAWVRVADSVFYDEQFALRAEAAAATADSEGNATAAQVARQGAEVAQAAAEDAQAVAETAQTAAEAAQGDAETAQAAAEVARDLAEQYAGVAHRTATWAAMAALSGTAGDIGYVSASDDGTHADPVSGSTVSNAGIYQWTTTGVGSSYAQRIDGLGLSGKSDKTETYAVSRVASNFVTPSATVHSAQAVSYADGALFSSSNHQTIDIACVAGQTYEVSLYRTGSTSIIGVAFLSAGGTLVQGYLQGTGSSNLVTNYAVTVPANAVTMRVCGRRADPLSGIAYSPRVQRVAKIDAGSIPTAVSKSAGAYAALAEYEPVETTILDGQYVNGQNGTLGSSGSYDVYEFTVTEGDQLKYSFSWLGSTVPDVAYYDASGAYLGAATGLGPGTVTSYIDVTTTVPTRAVLARLTQRTAGGEQAVSISRLGISDLSGRVGVIEDALREYRDDTPEFITGSYYSAYTGVITTSASYWRLLAPVTSGEDVYLTASFTGGSLALAVFFDAEMAFMGAYEINPGGGVVSNFSRERVTVPAGAAYLGMCQSIGSDVAMKLERHVVTTTIPARVESLEAVASSWWTGKTGVWFGTSIPTGNSIGGRYPAKVAAALGMTITNEAVSGSAICSGNSATADAGSGDPYGWAGHRWIPCTHGLAGTIAEKQDLIDNWATYRPMFSNAADAPVTLDATTQAAILDSSYENKLMRHIGDGNRKDVYIFDHGYNDVSGVAHDPSSGANDGVDRGNFYGAHNFLIDLILSDNPDAIILFISHFERWTGTGNKLVSGQRHLAEMWGRPLCDLSERLGWTQRDLTTTGYWDWTGGVEDSAGYWVASGGAQQTIPVVYAWCPDGTHPANDYSGRAVQRIADVLAPWFKSQM